MSAFVVAGCGSNTKAGTTRAGEPAAPAPVDRRTLRPVSLPDLSRLDAPVQKQLREGYAALTAKVGQPGISDVDLGFAYGEMGKLLMAAEYRDGAEPAFLDAEALMPNERRWPYYLAHLYKLKGEPARATAAFERALRLKPDDLPTLVWLGSAYLDQGRAADAEPLFATALSIAPRSVAVLFGIGRTALARQQYMRAIEFLEQALALDPKAVVIHFPLAMAYRAIGNTPQAEAHLRARGPGDIRPPDPLMQELDLTLESAVAYEVRGAAALDESNWVAAAGYFRKGIALAPNEPSLRHKLGTALAMTGDPRAVEQFEEVTRRWPKFAKAHYSLGLILASSGRNREAIEHFSAAVQSDPAYSEARLQLAETLRVSGRFQDSLRQYEETITLNPRLAEARLGYGMALAALKRTDEARKVFDEGAAGVRGVVEQACRCRVEPLMSHRAISRMQPRRHEGTKVIEGLISFVSSCLRGGSLPFMQAGQATRCRP
jgi:tetratricopeptide (TPR) repeat protein